MPSELWISANPFSLPTRVCVMSILVVSVRILYGIHGLGAWERSGSNLSKSKIDPVAEDATKAQFDAVELLSKLEAKYHDMQSVPGKCRMAGFLAFFSKSNFPVDDRSLQELPILSELLQRYGFCRRELILRRGEIDRIAVGYVRQARGTSSESLAAL